MRSFIAVTLDALTFETVGDSMLAEAPSTSAFDLFLPLCECFETVSRVRTVKVDHFGASFVAVL